jgi:alkane 1-monooxygenase
MADKMVGDVKATSSAQVGVSGAPGASVWADPKRYAWLLGLLVPLLPFVAWGLVAWTHLTVFWFAGPLVVFVVIPLLDWAIGTDAENPPVSALSALEDDRYYRWCTWAFIPIEYAGLVLACWLWSRGGFSIAGRVGLVLTVACVSGIAINTAHELGHKREGLERWLSKIALAPSAYGHFYVEHNRGHHVRVATPDDPASARFGESFYSFLPRTILGSLRSSIAIERTRLERSSQPFWSIKNDVLNAWAMTVVLFAALVASFGVGILPYLLLQAALGLSLLEVVNYLEHYGLQRQKRDDGKYERCLPSHSWNSNNIVSNVFLYHLQRHSDHHANPLRRYQALRSFGESPNLPSGYATMILVAWVPPLWRYVMDGRVVRHYGGDMTRANIQPSKRDAVLARYGVEPVGGE